MNSLPSPSFPVLKSGKWDKVATSIPSLVSLLQNFGDTCSGASNHLSFTCIHQSPGSMRFHRPAIHSNILNSRMWWISHEVISSLPTISFHFSREAMTISGITLWAFAVNTAPCPAQTEQCSFRRPRLASRSKRVSHICRKGDRTVSSLLWGESHFYRHQSRDVGL